MLREILGRKVLLMLPSTFMKFPDYTVFVDGRELHFACHLQHLEQLLRCSPLSPCIEVPLVDEFHYRSPS